MHLGVTRHAHPQVTADPPDQLDQLIGMFQATGNRGKRLVTLGRVTPQGHDVADPRRLDTGNPLDQLVTRRPHTRQVCGGRQTVTRLDLPTQFYRAIAGRAPGTVCARDEVRLEDRQAIKRIEQSLVTVGGLRWKDLDRDRRGLSGVDFTQRQHRAVDFPEHKSSGPADSRPTGDRAPTPSN